MRSEGKKLKGRPATQRHEKAIEDAAHEQRVATISEQDAFDALQAAVDEHGDEWAETIERDVQQLGERWAQSLATLVKLHAERSRAFAIRAMVVGGEQPGVAALGFAREQIRGIDFASGTGRQTGFVSMTDVLGKLAELGSPVETGVEPPVEHSLTPVFHDDGGREGAERRAFAEHAQSPEGREAVANARRERQAGVRRANEEALQATLEG